MVDISWATFIVICITLEWKFPRRVAKQKVRIELGGRSGVSSLFHEGVHTDLELVISTEDVFGTLAAFSLQLSFFGADEACGIYQI